MEKSYDFLSCLTNPPSLKNREGGQKPRTTGAKFRGRKTPRVRAKLPAKPWENLLHAGKRAAQSSK